jgi:transposase
MKTEAFMPKSPLLVDIPKEKISIKKYKGIPHYVYYVSGSKRVPGFKNPRPTEILIGTIYGESDRMKPNENYYNIYGTNSRHLTIESTTGYGQYLLFDSIIEQIGLKDIIYQTMAVDKQYLLSLALYMFSNGNVMSGANDWSFESYHYYQKPLVSKQISAFFESIDLNDRQRFFKAWSNHVGTHSYLAYDVTSISTYAKGLSDAEYGYNRDKEDLAQINLGIFFSYGKRLPVLYDNYPGSIIDKEQLYYVLKVIETYHLKNVSLVMDKGFYKEDNFQYLLNEERYGFIMPIASHYKRAREYIFNFNKAFDRYEQQIDDTLYGSRITSFIDSKYVYGYVYLDESRKAEEIAQITKALKADEILIGELLKKKRFINSDQYKNRLVIDGDSIQINKVYYDNKISRAGYLVIVSNLKLDVKEVIEIYRRKDMVEKCFDAFKNDIDFKRLHTHKQATTDGKLFTAFLSLIAKSFIHDKLKDIQEELKRNNLSVKDIVKEVSKIKVVDLSNQLRAIAAPTRVQKVIFKHVGMSEEKLKKRLEDLNNV